MQLTLLVVSPRYTRTHGALQVPGADRTRAQRADWPSSTTLLVFLNVLLKDTSSHIKHSSHNIRSTSFHPLGRYEVPGSTAKPGSLRSQASFSPYTEEGAWCQLRHPRPLSVPPRPPRQPQLTTPLLLWDEANYGVEGRDNQPLVSAHRPRPPRPEIVRQ